jgi:hypothetical protein
VVVLEGSFGVNEKRTTQSRTMLKDLVLRSKDELEALRKSHSAETDELKRHYEQKLEVLRKENDGLKGAVHENGPFVQLEYLQSAQFSRFIFRNTGQKDAYAITLTGLVYKGTIVKSKPIQTLAKGEQTDVLVEFGDISAVNLKDLLIHMHSPPPGCKSMEEQVSGMTPNLELRVEIVWQDPRGEISRSHWIIISDLLKMDTRVLPDTGPWTA